MPKLKSANELEQLRQKIKSERATTKPCVSICSGTGCRACGSENVYQAFVDELKKNKLQDKVDIRTTGCQGFCERASVVVIFPDEIFYLNEIGGPGLSGCHQDSQHC